MDKKVKKKKKKKKTWVVEISLQFPKREYSSSIHNTKKKKKKKSIRVYTSPV